MRKTTSATTFSESAMVSRCRGSMKKKFRVRTLRNGRRQRRDLASPDRHEEHREQIDHAQAGDRREVVEQSHDHGRPADCRKRLESR